MSGLDAALPSMELLTMTHAELRRRDVCRGLKGGHLTQIEAAVQLRISERQVRRLLRRYEREGDAGLISRRRGRPSNRRLDPALVKTALTIVATHYADFGPTHANEKLREVHGLTIATESLRQAMMKAGLHEPKRSRRRSIHRPRERRPQFGELIQIDGSPHDWFEGRAPKCTALVFVDDATSKLVGLKFVRSEGTGTYMQLLREYLLNYGRPLALYSDRHTIFRSPNACTTLGQTQFGRALEELDIELICANSPQAKGRVERAHQTLQRRLPRELRLAGVSTLEEANALVPNLILEYNRRFAQKPHCDIDAHRTIDGFALDEILTIQHERFLTTHATFQVGSAIYALDDPPAFARSRKIVIIERDGQPFIVRLGKHIAPYHKLRDTKQAAVLDHKQLAEPAHRHLPNPKKAHTPAPTHPWKVHPWSQSDRTSLLGADRT